VCRFDACCAAFACVEGFVGGYGWEFGLHSSKGSHLAGDADVVLGF